MGGRGAKSSIKIEMTERSIRALNRFKEIGIPILNRKPKDYKKIDGATTAPRGYTWYSNNKSRFSGERKEVLVKDRY